jgi:hypothetical protein
MSLSNLANWRPPVRANPAPKEPASVSVPSAFAPNAPATPAPAAPVQSRIAIENLRVDDIRDASISTINSLIPHNRKVVAQAIVESGERRRGERVTPMSAISDKAHAIVLSGMRRRAEKLSDADEAFLQGYLQEIGAS